VDAEQVSLEVGEGTLPHPSRNPENERHARYGVATDALFAPEINLWPRSFDVHGRRRHLESPSRRSPGTHSCLGCPPSLRLPVRPLISLRTLLSTSLFSQSLAVTPVEVKSVSPPTGTVKPEPTYTDGTITVYSIPLFPEVDGDGNPTSSRVQERPPLKRKRQASSVSPPRRGEDEGFSRESGNLPLTERMRLNGFRPTDLVGNEADQWRELVVAHMFPGNKPKSGNEADADPPYVSISRRHPGSFNPAGSDKQLPRMNFTKNSEPITHKQKPSLAYIVVGPKTRGKLDAKKADELGLKGRLRGLVANGNTVTFTTKDAHGKETERTVKPEECVGPGQNPAVCTGIPRLFSSS